MQCAVQLHRGAAPASTRSGQRPAGWPAAAAAARRHVAARAHVELTDLEGAKHVLEVAEDETILDVAIDAGLDMPYDCKMGVCLRCSAKIDSGVVEQPVGMITDECQAQGYALMCMAFPKSDCALHVIPEGELMDAVMT